MKYETIDPIGEPEVLSFLERRRDRGLLSVDAIEDTMTRVFRDLPSDPRAALGLINERLRGLLYG